MPQRNSVIETRLETTLFMFRTGRYYLHTCSKLPGSRSGSPLLRHTKVTDNAKVTNLFV